MEKNEQKDQKTTEKMVNIISKTTSKGNVEICLKDSKYYYLPFNKSEVNFSDKNTREKFIKSVERRVRRSKLYKAYINYLKNDLKMDRCAVFGNLQSDKKSKTKIEMHHGPIFTLYDYVSIVLTKFLNEKEDSKLNTFDVAAEVLMLHKRKLVTTVMLSEAVHKSMDNPKTAPFLTLEQTFGDLFEFVKEYGKYFSPKNIYNLKSYFDNYKYNLEHNMINTTFAPILTKYDIIFKEKDPNTGELK